MYLYVKFPAKCKFSVRFLICHMTWQKFVKSELLKATIFGSRCLSPARGFFIYVLLKKNKEFYWFFVHAHLKSTFGLRKSTGIFLSRPERTKFLEIAKKWHWGLFLIVLIREKKLWKRSEYPTISFISIWFKISYTWNLLSHSGMDTDLSIL